MRREPAIRQRILNAGIAAAAKAERCGRTGTKGPNLADQDRMIAGINSAESRAVEPGQAVGQDRRARVDVIVGHRLKLVRRF
ncbi:hypothetical protein D9M70_494080 [compost metagenome]